TKLALVFPRRPAATRGGAVQAEMGRVIRSILSGDIAELSSSFEVEARGAPEHWTLRLVPKSRELAQYLLAIHLAGGKHLDPVAEAVIARLSAAIGGRALFVVSHKDEAAARRAAERFAHELQGAGGWRLVVARLPAFDRSAPAKLYAARRFGLLSDADREQLSSGDFALRETALRQLVVPL